MQTLAGSRRGTHRAISLVVLAVLVAGAISGCAMTGADEYLEQTDPMVAGGDSAKMGVAEGESFDEGMAAEEMPAEDVEASRAPTTVDPDYDGERLVVRNVSIRIEVEDVESSVEEIRAATEAAGGIVSMLHVSTDESPVYRYEAEDALADGSPLSGYITVRVPADQLEAFNDKVAGLGEVLREDASQDDVTQQYVDLNARLKNLQAREERLRALYDEAETVEDTLAVDRELSAVRGEIEAMQAQIIYLERQAAMATVTIELTEPAPVVRPAGENWGFVDALTDSLRAFMTTVNGIIIIFGAILPLILIGLVILVIVLLVVRARRRKGSKDEGDDSTS
jgi:hypothetical protein